MNRRAFLASATCCFASASARAQAPVRDRFDAAAAYSVDRGGAALLVVRNGIVLCEHYNDGAAPGTLLPVGAGVRVFTALLAAAMVRDGLMRLDEPVAITLSEWAADPAKSAISVLGLINGTSGVAFSNRAAGDAAAAIALEPQAAPGARFIDDPASYVLFAEIARRKLMAFGRPTDPAGYLIDRTLGPIGCVPMAWARSADGLPLLYDGAAVSARGWAGVGELLRREGVWRAQQLVDGYTMRMALQGSLVNPRAGLGVWIAAESGDAMLRGSDLWQMHPPAPSTLTMAAGAGGERLYIIPSLNLVVVRQSRDLGRNDWSDAAFLSLLLRDV